jgi:hypothetical protein
MIDRFFLVMGLFWPRVSGVPGEYMQYQSRKRTLASLSPPNEATVTGVDATLPSSTIPASTRRRKKGRLSIDLHGNTVHILPSDDPFELAERSFENQSDEMSLTLTPMSALRLGSISLSASGAIFAAFMGTLRLLAPL